MRTYLGNIKPIGTALLLISIAVPTFAQDQASQPKETPGYEIQAGFGYSKISLNEKVYYDAGNSRLSHLIWDAKIPVAIFGARYNLTNDWTLQGNLTFSFGGNGDMTDYDWLEPHAAGTGDDQWTHRSQHPDTDLQRYIDLELALGRNFALNETTGLNLHGGLKYTKADLNALGGRYIRSIDGFRDDRGVIPDGQSVISYKQWHRTAFAGAEVVHNTGEWQFSGLVRAGVSIEPRDADDHWRRELRYDEEFDPAPFAQIRLEAKRTLKNGASIFAGAGHQKFFEKRGDAHVLDTATGGTSTLNNLVGADMSITTIDVGISRDF